MVSKRPSKCRSLSSILSGATMIVFKYKNKTYETPNLKKKLKRMKLSLEDIEIIEKNNPIEKNDDCVDIKEYKVYEDINTKHTYWFLIEKGTNPTIEEVFKDLLWNPETKTGVKEITLEYINKCLRSI